MRLLHGNGGAGWVGNLLRKRPAASAARIARDCDDNPRRPSHRAEARHRRATTSSRPPPTYFSPTVRPASVAADARVLRFWLLGTIPFRIIPLREIRHRHRLAFGHLTPTRCAELQARRRTRGGLAAI